MLPVVKEDQRQQLNSIKEQQDLEKDWVIVEYAKDGKDEHIEEDDDTLDGGEEDESSKQFLKFVSESILLVNTEKNNNITHVISKPDEFKSPHPNTYVLYEKAKIENLVCQLQKLVAQLLIKLPDKSGDVSESESETSSDEDVSESEEEDIEESVVNPRDMTLVMSQAGVSKAKAVEALKNSNGDIVSAIMELMTST